MGFKHGTSVSEEPSKIKGMVTAENPIVCIGTAPINMGDITCINKPQIIYTAEEAAQYFGGTQKIPGYTISEFLNATFNVFGIKPVICINVLDPAKHKKAETFTDKSVDAEKKVVFEIGVIPSTLKIKNASTSQALEYEGYFENDGTYVAEITTEVSLEKVNGEYDKLDPTMVVDNDIIGEVDLVTLKKQGLEVVNNIYPMYSMVPLVNIAPGFTSDEVRAALDTKTSKINNKWGSVSFVDMPETLKYGEAVKYKKDHNWIDSDQMIFYGKNRLGKEIYWQSILAALLMAEVTAKNDGVPYESPSNKNIRASGICYKSEEEYIDVDLDENQANLLNSNGITTTLKRSNGTVLWGNRTSIFQPGGETDPKETWLVYKCMFKYIGNTLMLNTEADVDKPMTFTRAESIETNINRWLVGLTNAGKLYGARVEFIESENPDMIEGKFVWHIYIGTVTPGESLHFKLEYDANYATSKLFTN